MAYLESLSTSELIKYLRTDRHSSSNFKKVEQILTSREEKTNNRVNGLEKDLEMFKSKCFELRVALEEKEKQNKNVESRLKEAELNKELCDNLKKTIVRMEENCKKSNERIVLLEDEVDKINRNKEEVLIKLNAEISDMKFGKAKVEDELQIYKGRCQELETRLMQLGKDVSDFKKELEIYKFNCSELAVELEKMENHNKAVESMLEELQGDKVLCKEKIFRMENDCKRLIERIRFLEDALDKTNRVKAEALNFLNAKITDLMGGKGRVENELEVQKRRCIILDAQLNELGRAALDMKKELETYKTKCSELFLGLEEKIKEKTVVEANLEELEANKIALKGELKNYEVVCNEQKEIIAQMEKDYSVNKDQEKWATEMMAFLEDELDKTNKDNKEVITKLNAENSELKFGKREVQHELEAQKKRCRELEIYKSKCSELSIALEKEKQERGFDAKPEELVASKMLCDELKGVVARLEEDCKIAIEREKMVVQRNLFLEVELLKISNAKDEVIDKLNANIAELECEKGRVEDGYKVLETRVMKLQIDVIALISKPNAVLDFEVETVAINRKGKNDAGKQTKIPNINHGLSELKVREKTGSCDGVVLDSADVDSHCCFPDMVSSGGDQVKGPTSVDLLYSNLDSVKEHKVSKPDSDMGNRSKRKMVFQSAGPTYRKLASSQLDNEDVTGVTDSEKKLVVPPKKKISDNIVKIRPSNQKGKETARCHGDRQYCEKKLVVPPKKKISDNFAKIRPSNQKGKETGSGHGDRHSSVLPLKRKRTLKLVCSDSDDDDDHITLTKRKMQIMKKASVVHRHSDS